MSVITGLVITMSIGDNKAEEIIRDFFKARRLPVPQRVDNSVKGRHPEVQVFVGAYNYLGFDEVNPMLAWAAQESDDPRQFVAIVNRAETYSRVFRGSEDGVEDLREYIAPQFRRIVRG